MFEKEAEEYAKQNNPAEYGVRATHFTVLNSFKDGAEFGYNKANEWHKVSDKLPELDVLVYLWDNVDDFPVVGCRHIPYAEEKWIWDCKWGDGYTVSQSAGKDYLWKEIVPPKEVSE